MKYKIEEYDSDLCEWMDCEHNYAQEVFFSIEDARDSMRDIKKLYPSYIKLRATKID